MALGPAAWGWRGSPVRWLLVVLVLAAPAFAQIDLDAADKLSKGTVEYVLAFAVVVLLGVCAYLFKALMDAKAEQRADQKEHHGETIGMLTSVVQLNSKMNEGFDVLEQAVEQLLQERRT